jgi:hypothetical protein
MRNDTKTIISIEMNNVDHANNLVKALELFFSGADCGGDCHLYLGDGYGWTSGKGFIGHDVRKAKISIKYIKEKVEKYNTMETLPLICRGDME